jgi:hypothetical protein
LDGDFTVSGLVPGRYFVSVQFDGETDYYCVPVEFEIRDNDITGLEIMAHRGLTLSGIVHVEDPHDPELAKRLRQLRVCVDSVGGTSPNSAREAPVNSDCSFTVRGLRPGPVQVSVGFNDVSKYFSIIRIEHPGPGVETLILSEMPVIFPDRPSLLIPREGLKNVRILLLYKGGSIRGHILVTGARPKSGTRLGAGISRHTGRETWSRGVHVDPNGGFILEGLGPGEYTVSVGTDAVGFPSRTKTVSVKNNCETRVSFLLDLSTKIGRN